MNVKERNSRTIAGKRPSDNNGGKFEIIQVGKIWAVKNNNPSKIIVYTEKKNEAVKIVKELLGV